ncbi:MAG: hypothetical protein H7A09_09170 [Oceanospirillaceae bacterium]|nr:hypothetical protein [Oceanospirillaceae bacterium]MCP5349631.1 hypothetical protein [Oceanospirillaceae bacterium]
MELKAFEKYVLITFVLFVCSKVSGLSIEVCKAYMTDAGYSVQAIALLKVPAFIAAFVLNLWAGIWLALEAKQLKLKIVVWMLFGFAFELYAVLLFYVFRMYTDHKKELQNVLNHTQTANKEHP